MGGALDSAPKRGYLAGMSWQTRIHILWNGMAGEKHMLITTSRVPVSLIEVVTFTKSSSNITVLVYFFLSFSNFLLIFYFSTYAPQPNVQYWPFQPLTFPSSTSWLVCDLRLRWRKGLPKIFANFVHVLYRKAYN